MIRHLVTLCTFALLACAQARAQEAGERRATGCVPPTPEQLAWERKNMVITRRVRLNRLGLERLNAERARKGLRALGEAEAGVAPLGAETEGLTAEAAAAAPAGAVAPADAEPAALPSYVDNSTLKYFPPIRSQGGIGSCAQWAGLYYCYTHMNALARNLDAKAGGSGNDSYIFSPKFTYNLVNNGSDGGSWYTAGWAVAQKHGCATWADWPYDSDYRGWPLTAGVWRNAINYRADGYGYVNNCHTAAGLAQLKTHLANGYVLAYATDIFGWQYKPIGDDPATTADDAFAGKSACYYCVTDLSGHAMTVVGYNDDIWIDINSNGSVDAGEKGALRIANSWGTSWGEAGFRWVAYDALKAVSAVSGGPSANRVACWWSNQAAWVTARAGYVPRAVAEFKLNHAERNQLRVWLGTGDTAATTPTTTWTTSYVLSNAGGAYAFNGTATACDADFVLDFSDILPTPAANRRWFLSVQDSSAAGAGEAKAYKLVKVSPLSEAVCADVPRTADNGTAHLWVEASYTGAPTISNIGAQTIDEDSATGDIPFTVGDAETAAGSLTLQKASNNTALVPTSGITFGGSGAGRTVKVIPAANKSGVATITVTVQDGSGLTASDSFVVTVNPVNDAPAISTYSPATPHAMMAGTSQVFEVWAHDDDDDPLSYAWTLDGTPVGLNSSACTYSPSAAGSHTLAVSVSDGNGTTASRSWSVTVAKPWIIKASVTSLKVSCKVGTSPAQKTFTVENDGTGTMAYTVAGDQSWMDCTPSSGDSAGEADTITVAFSAEALADGTYPGKITVTAADAGNSPLEIPVTLTVSTPKSGGGGGGGGGCSLITATGPAGALGWLLPWAAALAAWLVGRRRRGGA